MAEWNPTGDVFDADDPFAPARGLDLHGLLSLLETLDGAEEAAVVRSALEAGVPAVVVFDELQREVERRLMRKFTPPASFGTA